MFARSIKACLAATALCVLIATTSMAATEVKLREHATPTSRVIRLGDVAEVVSADRQQARRLAAVPLMPAPAPDTQRFLRKREIADMLQASGIELGEVRFSGAERVAVGAAPAVKQAAAQETVDENPAAPLNRHAAVLAGKPISITPTSRVDQTQAGQINALVNQAIAEYVKTKIGKPEIGEIECSLNDKQLAQLATATSTPVCGGGTAPWTGRQKFTLSFNTSSGAAQFALYAAVADAPVPVVIATRAVARGNPITAADVEVRNVDAKAAGQRPSFDSVEKVVGLEARQPLQVSDIVFADDVRSPIVVKRGEPITVSSQGGGIRVRTTAKALQDGSKGDLIQVESLATKQRYDARVAGFREATVFAPTRESTAPQTDQTHSATLPGKSTR